MEQIIKRALLLTLLTSVLSACAGTLESTNHSLPPSMQRIYQDATGEVGDGVASATVTAPNHTGQINTLIKEDRRFVELPNPAISLYVYPHFAGPEQTPVPGYRTVFFLYEHPHFALPGEVGHKGQEIL